MTRPLKDRITRADRRSRALVACLAVGLAACAGPRTPLEVGVKEFPTDVLYGKRAEAPPPPPAFNPNPGFPILIQPPPRVSSSVSPPPSPSPLPCPTAHPFAAPKYEARSRGRAAPLAANYPFRNKGSFENTGASKSSGTFPPQTKRTVTKVQKASDGSFTFQIEEDLLDRFTTTSYRVVPDSPLSDQAGVFITQIVTRFRAGGSDSFTPATAIRLLAFPAASGTEWDSIGTDPLTQMTMRFHARIGIDVPNPEHPDQPGVLAKARVDACGVVLDAWYVQIKDGQILGANTDLDFKSIYAVVPQFGGFPVMEDITVTGTDRGTQTKSHNLATISKEPIFPGEY